MSKHKNGTLVNKCAYGENPQQSAAALYSSGTDDPLALDQFQTIAGNPASFNNLCDLDRLLQTATHIAEALARRRADRLIAIGVKHGNPCGAAIGLDPVRVLENMFAGDPLAIFGGLVLTNFPINQNVTSIFGGKTLDGIVAPEFQASAIESLKRKTGKCRFIANASLSSLAGKIDTSPRKRYVRGGWLEQENYLFIPDLSQDMIVKRGTINEEVELDMLLAWAIGSTSNSNTVTLVRKGQLLGNGVGQQDRVGAAQLAVARAKRAGHKIENAVAYSDSFFPFRDGVETLVEAGVRGIFTSSGAQRDQEIIDYCLDHNVTLYMVPDKAGRGFFGH